MLAVLAILAAGLGYALASALTNTSHGGRPDLALRFAFLVALPLPVALLGHLTTPRHAAVRRLLGETAGGMLGRALRQVGLWLAVGLVVPAVIGLEALATYDDRDAEDLGRAAAMLSVALVLATGLGVAGLLAALRLMAGGRHAGWAAISGGGAFGPVQAAPLLYAPAFSLVAALVPPAVLAAAWGAKASLLSLAVGVEAFVAAVVIAAWTVRAQVQGVQALLQHGMLAVEQAHATRFAESTFLPEPSGWLLFGNPSAAHRFLARAWSRRHPAPWLAPFGLVALALALLSGQPAEELWRCDLYVNRGGDGAPPFFGLTLIDLATPALAAAVAAYSALRVEAMAHGVEAATAAWLGATPATWRQAVGRLALGLSVPALALAGLAAMRGTWLPTLGGAAVGFAGGLVLARAPLSPNVARLLPRLALAGFGAALAATIVAK